MDEKHQQEAPLTRRVLRERAARSAQGARLRALLGSAVALTIATGLGLGAAGGTYALFNAQAVMPGATVSSGTMDLLVNGASSASLGAWNVSPARAQSQAFTVTNRSTVPVDVSASAITTSASAISADTVASLAAVTGSAACTTGSVGARVPLNGYTRDRFVRLAAGETATLCLDIGLRAGTPASRSGQSAPFTLTLTSYQREN